MAGAMQQKQQGYRNGAAYGISEHLFVDVSHRMHMEVLTYCVLTGDLGPCTACHQIMTIPLDDIE